MTDSLRFSVVIPARYASQRLPGKPLLEIAGRPMLAHVWERARLAGAESVIIATDDTRIEAVAHTLGAQCMLTEKTHRSGTDRVFEVADRSGWEDDHIVVNVQGDEPLISPENIVQVARLCADKDEADMATLCTPLADSSDFSRPECVKVVTRADGCALYFSRAPIPYQRDSGPVASWSPSLARRHIGLYGYRVHALRTLATAEPCAIENHEHLEQLRALWLGLRIHVAEAEVEPSVGVDTAEELREVREQFARNLKSQ